jgi:hypothetical protein
MGDSQEGLNFLLRDVFDEGVVFLLELDVDLKPGVLLELDGAEVYLYEVDGGVVEISEEVRILRVDVERLFGLVDFLARLRTVLVQEVICTVADLHCLVVEETASSVLTLTSRILLAEHRNQENCQDENHSYHIFSMKQSSQFIVVSDSFIIKQ